MLLVSGQFLASTRWENLLPTLLLQRHNTAMVVIAATLLGLAAGIVGTFALLRKRAMMGDALAHCTLPGIALAFLVSTWLGGAGRSLPTLLVGASVSGILGVLTILAIVRSTRLREDAAIAATLSVFFGLGILLLSYIQGLATGTQGGLGHFIYGQTAAMQRHDALLMAAAAAIAVAAALLLFKEFRLVCFDDRFAAAAWGGDRSVLLVDLLMMALVVFVTVIGLQAVGLLLIIAMLIIPAAAARFWTERFGLMTVLAGFTGALSGYLGSSASAMFPRMPAGAVIVLSAGAIFFVSLLAAPRRGVVASTVRHARLRLHIARDHFLRAAYEAVEPSLSGATAAQDSPAITISEITRRRRWSRALTSLLVRLLAVQRLVATSRGAVTLTPRGVAEAARITRNHRLWEEFLVRHADMAASHVDRTADLVEHILSPEIVTELELSLANRRHLPAVPPSLHPIQT
jgi:manganese/zinc/iron transport system permease protein